MYEFIPTSAGVSTSVRPGLDVNLSLCGLLERFEECIECLEDLERSSPTPAVFLVVVDAMGV